MRRFSEPKTAAAVGEARFIGWVAADARVRLAVRMPEDKVSTAKYRVFERPSASIKGVDLKRNTGGKGMLFCVAAHFR